MQRVIIEGDCAVGVEYYQHDDEAMFEEREIGMRAKVCMYVCMYVHTYLFIYLIYFLCVLL